MIVDDPPARREEDLLLLLAEVDPERARRRSAEAVVRACAHGNVAEEVLALRALGVSERLLGKPREGLAHLDDALARAGAVTALEGLVRTSRAACLMAVGDVSDAVSDIDRAIAVLDGTDRAIAVFQRASILARLGDGGGAATALDTAIPLLQRGGAAMYEAHARTNRGLTKTYSGEFGPARRDLERARALYVKLGMDAAAALALQNLAFFATRSGDVIGALAMFEQARRDLQSLGLSVGVLDFDACEALLAAGLATEAFERAAAASGSLAADGDEFEVPEAQLIAALACLQADDPVQARHWATTAASNFRKLDRTGWADLADLVGLRASAPQDVDAGVVRRLAERLAANGLLQGAAEAQMLVADLMLQRGAIADAAEELRSLHRGRLTPDLRIGLCDIGARLALATGDRTRSRQWLRAGIRDLDRFQTSFASTEIRWSVAVHARRLLRTGRDDAVARGGAANVFRWIELGRMNGLRRAPMHRPADPRLAELLGELRVVLQELREPDDPGTARSMLTRRTELQRAITDRERALRSGGRGDDTGNVVSLTELRRHLDGRRLVEIDLVDDRMIAVVTDGHRSQLIDIGPGAPILALFGAANLALGRLARTTSNVRSVSAAFDRLASISGQLDDRFAPCLRRAQPVIVVPPAELHAAAWALVPALRRVPFAVAPSATTWLHATRRSATSRRVVLVAGAHLREAASEVRAIGRVHPQAVALVGARATAGRVTDAVDGAWLAHFATHHQHQRENPLFGSMQMADGPLFLHDLLRVPSLPSVIVLSACDAAQGSAGPADDVLNAATVFMERGTTSVIASPSRVADSADTTRSMLLLHTRLAAGDEPANALLALREEAAGGDRRQSALAAAYSCFGRG